MPEATENSTASTSEHNKFRLPSIPKYWENFLISILLHLLLPLFPLAIEYMQTESIGKSSLVLAASMYTISIGVSSRSRLMFAFTIAASVFYAFLYGIVSIQTSTSISIAEPASFWGILATFIFHAGERFNRHVVDRTPFWEFMSD